MVSDLEERPDAVGWRKVRDLDGAEFWHDDEEFGRIALSLEVSTYFHGGRQRIDVVSNEHGPWATLTVNDQRVKLEPGEFLVKVHDQEETVASALASGLFEDTGRRERLGYTEAQVWKVR